MTNNFRTRTVIRMRGLSDTGLRRHCDVVHQVWRANAYIISIEAMRRILDREEKIIYLADDWSRRLSDRTLDAIYYPEKPLFQQDTSLHSTIGAGRKPQLISETRNLMTRAKESLWFRRRKLGARLLSQLPIVA